MTEEKLRKHVLYGICCVLGAAALWLLMKYVLPILAPFILACLVSCGVRPLTEWLSRKTKLRRGFFSAVIIVLGAALLTYLLYIGMSVLMREAAGALAEIMELLEDKNNPVSRIIEKLTNAVDGIKIGGADMGRALYDMAGAAATQVSSLMTQLAGKVLGGAPSFVFSFFVGLISLFYFSADWQKIKGGAERFLPPRAVSVLHDTQSLVKRALLRFAKAYLTILAVTFAELFIGFSLIGVDYALLAALVTALVDILPVLGVGTVLVPWAIVLFIGGKTSTAIGMLALLLIIYAVRQIIEPKIVGSSAGVHPVAALISVYAGFRLAGLVGMIAAPVILSAAVLLLEEKIKSGEKASKSGEKSKQ